MTTRDTYDIEQAQKMDIYEILVEIMKWHAQIQIDFFNELNEQEV